MTSRPPRSVVLTWDENLQQLVAYTLDPRQLAPLIEGKMGVVMADEQDVQFDDELARQLGVGLLNVIVQGRPDLAPRLSVTQQPIDDDPKNAP